MVRQKLVRSPTNNAKNPRSGISRKVAVSAVGVACIVLGSYLPWLQENPWRVHPMPVIIPYFTSPGIEWIHLVLILPAVVVLLVLAVRGTTRGWAISSIITGFGAILFPVILGVSQFANSDPSHIPDVGWGLTILGGFVLVIVPVYYRYKN